MNQQDDIALDPGAGCRMTATEVLAAGRAQFPHLFRTEDEVAEMDRLAGECRARAHVSPPLGMESTQSGLFAPEPTAGVNVCILALDLGTKTGYAVRKRDGKIVHGTQSFAPRATWSPGQRWLRFRSWLGELLDLHQVGRIAYEHVSFHAGVRDAHCYGAFRAFVEMAADTRRIELVSTNVQTIKKHWTGKGGADKAAMIEQARKRGFRPETDNDADALAVLDWAVAQERAA